MGYSYTASGALCCDHCCRSGGVHKRHCVHHVTTAEGGTHPYCPAPALCADCLRELGGLRALHARCAEPARRATEREREIRARLEAGDLRVATRWGDWHALVPSGFVGARFVALDRREEYRLVRGGDERADWLSDCTDATPWPEGARA